MEDVGLLPPLFLSLKEKIERASRDNTQSYGDDNEEDDEKDGLVMNLSRKW